MSEPAVTESVAITEKLVALAENAPLSVAALDVDGLGNVNGTFGRPVGDQLIATLHAIFAQEAGSAFLARSGGDEFLLAFAGTSPEQTLIKIETLREELARPRTLGEVTVTAPVSAGIASYPHHTEDPAEQPDAARAALLKAKQAGGNRVSIYVEEKMVLKSNYYARAQLARLGDLAKVTSRSEASLLREALADLLDRHRNLT